MSPLITSSSFIFPNSLISCCYCYFAASLCFPRVKLISHFLLLPTSSPPPLTINCLHTTLYFPFDFSLSRCIFFLSLVFSFVHFLSMPFIISTNCTPLFGPHWHFIVLYFLSDLFIFVVVDLFWFFSDTIFSPWFI